ncbi:MAG: hypothetical protein HQL60_05075 [Magnetococcales bacterium]|nr:hypothetical protein [Magnetococcales bacterium]
MGAPDNGLLAFTDYSADYSVGWGENSAVVQAVDPPPPVVMGVALPGDAVVVTHPLTVPTAVSAPSLTVLRGGVCAIRSQSTPATPAIAVGCPVLTGTSDDITEVGVRLPLSWAPPAVVVSAADVRSKFMPAVRSVAVASSMATVATATQQVTGPAERWTIMVYMAADNDLEGQATSDLNEIESVHLPEAVQVTVLLDRSPAYSRDLGDWSDTRRGVIRYDGSDDSISTPLTSLGELNTSAPGTLTDFIRWSRTTQPADHYVLVVWGHGGGIYGTCEDESSGDYLMPVRRMSNAIGDSGVHFDMIGFDTCLQGMVEQAVEIAPYTDILVASEEDTPADGWNYAAWLGHWDQQPTVDAAALARYAVTDYAASYRSVASPVTLSAVDSRRLPMLTAAINRFVVAAQGGSSADWQAMRAARDNGIGFPDGDSWGFVDLGNYMQQVAAAVPTAAIAAEAAAVQRALSASLLRQVDTRYGSRSVTGLSVYLPSSAPVSFYSDAKWRFLRESNWDSFAQTLANNTPSS